MIFITPMASADIDLIDLLFESLSVLGYLFVLFMTIRAKKRNKIFAAKPYPLLITAVAIGLISAVMDVLSELYFIDFYSIYKLTLGILQILSLFLFAIGMILLFRFTTFLLGDDQKN